MGASTGFVVGNPTPVSETPILELRGISKSFGSVQALADVDFEVRDGEVMALVGDNGAGKSTLVKCVAGINGFRKNGSKKEPTVALPVVSITKANYTRLFKDKFLKKSDVCVGEFKQFC